MNSSGLWPYGVQPVLRGLTPFRPNNSSDRLRNAICTSHCTRKAGRSGSRHRSAAEAPCQYETVWTARGDRRGETPTAVVRAHIKLAESACITEQYYSVSPSTSILPSLSNTRLRKNEATASRASALSSKIRSSAPEILGGPPSCLTRTDVSTYSCVGV